MQVVQSRDARQTGQVRLDSAGIYGGRDGVERESEGVPEQTPVGLEDDATIARLTVGSQPRPEW